MTKDHRLDAICEPRAYLHTIARGLLINHWRRKRIEQAYLDALMSARAAGYVSGNELIDTRLTGVA